MVTQESITVSVLLLAAVVASSGIARANVVPLPLPLIQVALGALIAQLTDFRISLDPEVFLLLFIAPLLFLDGWRIPKQGLFRDKWTIIALALGLVLFTVLGAGFFVHWMIPEIPLAIAFALASVLAPTDAVAISAIAERAPIPKRLMHILEGESLLNDASGLVCMRFAVAAALTGTFSIAEASVTFLWLAVAGSAIGAVVALLANAAKDWVANRFGEDTGAQILTSLLIPFAAFIAAEHLQASGILAVVAAGLVMSYEERSGRALAGTRVRRAAVWDAVQFAGNGTIFVLLGQQLPGIVTGAGRALQQAEQHNPVWLLIYVAALTAVLAILRGLWAWATLRVVLFRKPPGRTMAQAPGWRLIAATTLAGVRGALTLSAVMTLPLALQNGTPLPARDLVIFLAAGVILASLIAANVGLPYLMKGITLPLEAWDPRKEDAARLAAAQAAIHAIEQAIVEIRDGEPDAEARLRGATQLMEQYRHRIDLHARTGKDALDARKNNEIARNLHIIALRAERNELHRIAQSGELSDELRRLLIREIDLQEWHFGIRQVSGHPR